MASSFFPGISNQKYENISHNIIDISLKWKNNKKSNNSILLRRQPGDQKIDGETHHNSNSAKNNEFQRGFVRRYAIEIENVDFFPPSTASTLFSSMFTRAAP